MASDLTIAAIIPTYRRDNYCLATVEALLEQTRVPDEIIVVDQTPAQDQDPEARQVLRSLVERAGVKLVRQDRPRVYEARNRAAHVANSRILLYLDDDVVLPHQLVEHHLAHYFDTSVDAVVGPAPKPGTEALYPVPDGFDQLTPEVQAYRGSIQFLEPITSVGCIHAGNFSIRRRVLAEVGGWDECIITYGDRDLGIRLARKGYRIDYDPVASLIHLAAPAGGTRLSDHRAPWNSWQRCVSLHMLAWRHLWRHPVMFAKYGLFRAARFSFLLRHNAVRPWRWPAELAGYLLGMFIGLKGAIRGPQCSFPLD